MKEKTNILLNVDSIIYKNKTYHILKVKTLKIEGENKRENNVIIKGNFLNIFRGDTLEINGEWKMEKDGYVFYSDSYKKRSSEMTIKNYLTNVCKLGKITTEKVWSEYGLETLNVIKEDHNKLSDIKGISKKRTEQIYEKVMDNEEIESVFITLLQYNLSSSKIFKLFEKYNVGVIDKLKTETYLFIESNDLTYKEVVHVLNINRVKEDDVLRLKCSLINILKLDNSRGNVFTIKEDIYKQITNFNKEEIDNVISSLIEEKSIIEEIVENVRCIYYRALNYTENKVSNCIKDLLEDNVSVNTSKIDKFLEDKSLTNKQKEAVKMALTERISILTGGPGTGKTHTLNTLVKTIKHKGSSFVLLAPTGKASKRMAEMTGEEAYTVHRALQIEDGQAQELIEEDFLIIDESSMLDLKLFEIILSSIDDNTQILLVGDYNQLPSVGAGSVFRDLIESKQVPTTILDEVFRQSEGSSIVVNSHKIINEEEGLIFDNSFEFIEKGSIIEIKDTIISILEKENIEDVQILTTTRDLSNLLNVEVQELINKEEEKEFGFKKGDKVIHTKNNYDLDVFNGEIGVVNNLNNNLLEVDFGDKSIEYEDGSLNELELAYAITTHKSQGSEFPIVIIPIHNSQSFMNTRNLLYTAITRASSRVILVGEKEEFIKSLGRVDSLKRNSNLVYKLNN